MRPHVVDPPPAKRTVRSSSVSIPAEVHAFAPGRVNLIGEHTDHTGGRCLPMAVAMGVTRSEEHTSALQSLMRISYAVFCLKKKNNNSRNDTTTQRRNLLIK